VKPIHERFEDVVREKQHKLERLKYLEHLRKLKEYPEEFNPSFTPTTNVSQAGVAAKRKTSLSPDCKTRQKDTLRKPLTSEQ